VHLTRHTGAAEAGILIEAWRHVEPGKESAAILDM